MIGISEVMVLVDSENECGEMTVKTKDADALGSLIIEVGVPSCNEISCKAGFTSSGMIFTVQYRWGKTEWVKRCNWLGIATKYGCLVTIAGTPCAGGNESTIGDSK